MITMDITSPIMAITNSVTKAMITPLQSSKLLSLEGVLVTTKNNKHH